MKKLIPFLCLFFGIVAFVACENPNSPNRTEFSKTSWKKVVSDNTGAELYTVFINFDSGNGGEFTAQPYDMEEVVKPDHFSYTIENDTIKFQEEKYAYFHYYRWKLTNAIIKEQYGRVLVVQYQYYLNGNWVARIDEFEEVK